MHDLGWREARARRRAQRARASTRAGAPLSTALGVLGMPGLTAYVGIVDIGQVEDGDTVFVSGAAGAVGSIAAPARAAPRGARDRERGHGREGRLARRARLRRRLRLPRDADRARRCASIAPDGIDVYFDNVGGETLEAAIGALRLHGRVVACGSISRYNATEAQPGPRNLFMVVTKRLRIAGVHRLRPLRPVPPRSSARSRRSSPTGRSGYRETSSTGSSAPRRRSSALLSGRERREDARPRRPEPERVRRHLCRSSATGCRRAGGSSSPERRARCVALREARPRQAPAVRRRRRAPPGARRRSAAAPPARPRRPARRASRRRRRRRARPPRRPARASRCRSLRRAGRRPRAVATRSTRPSRADESSLRAPVVPVSVTR